MPQPTPQYGQTLRPLLLSLLLLLPTRLVGHVHIRLRQPLLGEQLAQTVHLTVQCITHAGMATDEGHLGRLVRRHIDANVQAPQLSRFQLDIRRLEILAGQVHDPVHQTFGPGALVHGQRLVQRAAGHRHRIGGLGRGGLGQVGQAVGKIVHTGITAGALGVFQPVFEQCTECLLTGFRLPAVSLRLLDHVRQGIDGHLTIITLRLRRIGSRGGMCRHRAFGLRALLKGQAQGRQVGQRVDLWIERLHLWFFRQWADQLRFDRLRRSLQHRCHRFCLGLDQLRAWLCVGDLASDQARVQHAQIIDWRSIRLGIDISTGLALIVRWQFIAAIGNTWLVGSFFLAVLGRLRLVLRLGCRSLVISGRHGVTALLGHHLVKAAALPARRLRRLVDHRADPARRLAHGVGLQQRIGCDRHREVSAPNTKKTSGQRQAKLAPSRNSTGGNARALTTIEALNLQVFLVDSIDQVFDAIQRLLPDPLFQLMAQARQADRAHVAATALEAVSCNTELMGIPGLVQLAQPSFGVFQESLQQLQVAIFHDLLQIAEHLEVNMHVSHLFTP